MVADEESYVESTWIRPHHHPTSYGPRVLRILSPIPLSNVIDVTSSLTNGNLIEGVVNRIVLKLQAGQFEYCYNVQCRILCKHTFTDGFDDDVVVEESTTVSTTASTATGNTDFDTIIEDANNNPEDKTMNDDSNIDAPSSNISSSRRTPLLVVSSLSSPSSSTKVNNPNTYSSIPSGWDVVDIDQQNDYTQSISDNIIEPGNSSYVNFELYRPLPLHPIATFSSSTGLDDKEKITKDNNDNNSTINISGCKTDYEVIFTYNQIRQQYQQQQQQGTTTSNSDDNSINVGNIVTLYHRGSYQWSAPLTAQFSVISKGPHKAFPCGNRHISNLIDSPNNKSYNNSLSLGTTDSSFGSFNMNDDDSNNNILSSNDYYSAIDDEPIRVRCKLIPTIVSPKPDSIHNHPAVFVDKVMFENDYTTSNNDLNVTNSATTSDDDDNNNDNHSPSCDLTYIPSYSEEKRKEKHLAKDTIFSSKCTAGPTIYSGSKFSLSYLIKPRINLQSSSALDYNNIFFQNHNSDITAYNATTSLGVISIYWNPIPIPLATSSKTTIDHGPLPSSLSCNIKFLAPQVRVEYAPFEAKLSTFPFSPPKVSTPFNITYSIKNKTPLHQKLSVTMSELPINATSSVDNAVVSTALSPTSIIEKVKSDGILLSGFINGEITLSPYETKTFEYCILAIRAGRIMLPTLSVVSARYKSWVVCDAANPRNLYILP